ncbi:putative bifunctional diguanylate cyclase/phosphodiesterase [Thiobacillus denitrificans]|uniref:putative bifunctional diguanylate cyclase/phosphodiesterase n=1 Tax=Thiobacillus denitrificans TaxID=36861 RepID=UPI000AD5E747|nr:GGDEF domain-containing phosphodiesterase [Thiobacillus denitrificans]
MRDAKTEGDRLGRQHESYRIGIVGGLILVALTLASGIAVYAVMQRQAESILIRSLEASLQSGRRLFESEISAGVTNALTVSTRSFVIHNLQLLKAEPDNEDGRQALQQIAESLQPTGFAGVSFQDSRDNEIVRAGRLSENPALSVPLNTHVEARLLWNGQLILQVVRDVVDEGGNRIGTARTESTLPHLTRAIADAEMLGKTADLAVCAPLEQDMQCFPLTLTQRVFPRIARTVEGRPLPMSHALDGETGTVFTRDYRRKNVVAAYTPMGTLGPGMVLKIDQAKLFGPVKQQLQVIVPLLGGLVLAGMLLLSWLVAPLVRKLVLSKQALAEVNARLRDVEERWRFALDSTGAGVWDLDIPGNRILLSSRCKAMLGFADDEIGTDMDDWERRIHPDDMAGLAAARQTLIDGSSDTFTNEHRKRCKDGRWKWIQVRGMVAARDAAHAPVRVIGTYLDISERKQAEETIQRQANFDPLTQLPNRRLFLDRLELEINKSRRADLSLALLLIDLDEFKEVNDTLGHDVGDILLQEAAQRIRGCIRDADTVARLGGDEFTVILTELSGRSHVEDIAQKIIGKLAEPFQLGNEVTYISASIGITLYPTDASDIDTLMKHADQAMYAAKKQGRNRFSHFTPLLQEAAQARLKLSKDLREAISDKQFTTHFQPIIDLATGRIHKAEALLRWQHPVRGQVDPIEFIALAEETGLIHEIGDWVFRESAHWAKQWSTQFGKDFRVSINMSPVQFRMESRVNAEAWLNHFRELGFSGENLIVEITEGLLLNAHSDVIDKLFMLRDAGIQIAIDDFGTGYSSLSYLKQFPIDYLKIDRSFVRDLETDPNDMALSKAIIVMAHELGLKVVAEGVETEGQRSLLSAAGCDYAQGNLYAKPLPPTQFEAMLRSR